MYVFYVFTLTILSLAITLALTCAGLLGLYHISKFAGMFEDMSPCKEAKLFKFLYLTRWTLCVTLIVCMIFGMLFIVYFS